jgi:DNA-binding transcriptional MerR regulator
MAQRIPTRKRSTGKALSPAQIPDKLYFRIGDVASICAVPAYVLRFWESEFPQLKPNKGGTGQRLYRRRDVECALTIKRLLYDEGFTINGARQALKEEQKPATAELPFAEGGHSLKLEKQLQKLRKELREILEVLSKPSTVTQLTSSRFRQSSQPEAVPKPEHGLFKT